MDESASQPPGPPFTSTDIRTTHGLVRYGTGPVRRNEPSAIHDAILFADAPTPDASGSPSTNGNGMKAYRWNLLLAPRPTSSPMLSTGVSGLRYLLHSVQFAIPAQAFLCLTYALSNHAFSSRTGILNACRTSASIPHSRPLPRHLQADFEFRHGFAGVSRRPLLGPRIPSAIARFRTICAICWPRKGSTCPTAPWACLHAE
ncbi:hypothetical protein K466DRAFT_15046 [Polyporus arcularius HHB13444]|uniref:Uncharacterized protein n=1 Tax=Polyporus arcularius HHB13444 TaxID=1314778 RepID=A0A5C3NPM9_9APHY|nr:hypothetical protein K466DRAFT_15046 [Polyporus arcularius HHB13444]